MSDEDKRSRFERNIRDVGTDCGYFILSYGLMEDALCFLCVRLEATDVQPYDVKAALKFLREPEVEVAMERVAPGLLNALDDLMGPSGSFRDWRDCVAHGVLLDITEDADGGLLVFAKRMRHSGELRWFHWHIPRRALRQACTDLQNLISEIRRVGAEPAARPKWRES